ncbi:hypothetical protein [Leptospira stimsonii]|uniref:Uncharacterized protein n=1 Tax=Leptospira stimsonii TaxID=2202203 RepID=A0ABY2N564_9LEPT|nr:hypothetical protein [Leptospira stimsonii]TGK10349.1 hypothetical protein EHO98_22825 [Leptospira stimsonii]TGM17248.1 hypothetical protein EHQ90_07640 [Leptospira stimsonii]
MSENRSFQFRAEPNKVTIIRPDGTGYPIITYDGTGIMRAATLDKITEDYQDKRKEMDNLKNAIDPFSHTPVGELSSEQLDLLDRFRKAGSDVVRYYYDYCKAAVPDLDKHLVEIDRIPKDQINVFIQYLVTATLGGESEKPDLKKYTSEEYVKKNRKNRRRKKKPQHSESSKMNVSADGNTLNRK